MSTSAQNEAQSEPGYAGQNEQPTAWAIVTIAYIFACLAVPLRFYARKRAKAAYGWDDWLILAVLVPLSGFFALFVLQIKGGMGKHITYAHNTVLYQAGYVGSIACYTFQTTLCKASVLCFYCRVFRNRALTRLCWAIGIFVGVSDLAMLIFDFTQCIPLTALFNGDKSKCVNPITPLVTVGIVNAVIDFLMLGIPLYFILQLKMRLARKIQLACIFLLGGVVCIFGVLRIVAHYQIREDDLTYTMTWASTWSFCETAVAVVCASLPTLSSLLIRSDSSSDSRAKLRALYSSYKSDRSAGSSIGSQPSNMYRSQISNFDPLSSKTGQHSVRVWAGTNDEEMSIGDADEKGGVTGETSQKTNTDVAADPKNQRGILVQFEIQQRVEEPTSTLE